MPALAILPVILPVCLSSVRSSGKLVASKVSGLFPVAAIVNKNGFPGLTPKIFAQLICGLGDSFGVRIYFVFAGNFVSGGSYSFSVILHPEIKITKANIVIALIFIKSTLFLVSIIIHWHIIKFAGTGNFDFYYQPANDIKMQAYMRKKRDIDKN